jgi:hypothetical protein
LSAAKAMDIFHQRSKKLIHVLISANPGNDELRESLRMYPQLVNCTTIDWFQQWPEEALLSIAHAFLSKIDYLKHMSEAQIPLTERLDVIENAISTERNKSRAIETNFTFGASTQ